jgi:hypothetical protein
VAAPVTGVVAYTLNGMNMCRAGGLQRCSAARAARAAPPQHALALTPRALPPARLRSYNPLEAGFSSGNGPTMCSTSGYYCAGGMDLATCEAELAYTCGTSGAASLATSLAGNMMGDSCNGHAMPYHFHKDAKCEYSPAADAASSAVTAHSPLVGLALDGYGIYGAWEGAGAAPQLDACNGHVGPVPGTASVASGSATSGITGLVASTSVYHCACGALAAMRAARRSLALLCVPLPRADHFSTDFPHTLGCYGGGAAVSTATCRTLYPNTCNTWVPTFDATGDMSFYDGAERARAAGSSRARRAGLTAACAACCAQTGARAATAA